MCVSVRLLAVFYIQSQLTQESRIVVHLILILFFLCLSFFLAFDCVEENSIGLVSLLPDKSAFHLGLLFNSLLWSFGFFLGSMSTAMGRHHGDRNFIRIWSRLAKWRAFKYKIPFLMPISSVNVGFSTTFFIFPFIFLFWFVDYHTRENEWMNE